MARRYLTGSYPFAAILKGTLMRRTLSSLSLILAGTWMVSPVVGVAQQTDTSQAVPEEVLALEGTFSGAWTMYGIDAKGEIVENMAWTDTLVASEAQIEGDRAFVFTTDEMVFQGGQIPPFTVQGREGYYLDEEGGVGPYFIETMGQMYRMVEVGESVWSYTAPAAAQELGRLGFPGNASGQHVLVKVVTREQGVETHRISRLTVVNWKDDEGRQQVTQFVSLQGSHQRLQ